MAGDYIPDGEALFEAWQGNFVTYVNDHLSELGLSPADVLSLNGSAASWTADYSAHTAAQAAARAARQAKDHARSALEGDIRPLVRRLQASPNVDDAERVAMSITVPDRVPTLAGPPGTRPLVRVDSGQRLRHTLHFADEATPTRRLRPSGVLGAEVWVKVGDPPPSGAGELRFLALATRTPHVARFPGTDGGQTAHYMLRWLATTGQIKGPWSETASATIGA